MVGQGILLLHKLVILDFLLILYNRFTAQRTCVVVLGPVFQALEVEDVLVIAQKLYYYLRLLLFVLVILVLFGTRVKPEPVKAD